MEYNGLNDGQVHKRLMRDGANELPSQKPQTIVSIFVSVIREPMLLLLLGCGSIYFLLGAMRDALMLVTFVLYVPYLRTLFHFSYLHVADWLLSITVSFVGLLWFDIIKVLKPKKIAAWTS